MTRIAHDATIPGSGRPSQVELAAYVELATQARHLLDAVCAGRPDPVVAHEAAGVLKSLTRTLSRYDVPVSDRLAGRLLDSPGRGGPLIPIIDFVDTAENHVSATVRFRAFHHGWGGATHGGVISMMFDELLGRVVLDRFGQTARTAYLNTSYRALTPIDVDLQASATLVRSVGRRYFVEGRVCDNGQVVAEGEALYVVDRP